MQKYRVSKKRGDLFYDQYLHQIRHKTVGYIFHLKDQIHRSIRITKKTFCTISVSWDISKSKSDFKKGFDSLESWNFTCYFIFFFSCSLMLYRNGFGHETWLRMSHLKYDISQTSKMFIAREIMHKSSLYQKIFFVKLRKIIKTKSLTLI